MTEWLSLKLVDIYIVSDFFTTWMNIFTEDFLKIFYYIFRVKSQKWNFWVNRDINIFKALGI